MKELSQHNFKSQLVVFLNIKTVGRYLNEPDLYASKEGERKSRPGVLQKSGYRYFTAFLSTKGYSKMRFKVLECCPLASRVFLHNDNYFMSFKGSYLFEFPEGIIEKWRREKWIEYVAMCSIDLQNVNWSGENECISRE